MLAVSTAVWAVGDADGTVRTLKDTHRQYQLEQQYRREARELERGLQSGDRQRAGAPGGVMVRRPGSAGAQGFNRGNQQGLQAAYYEQQMGHRSKSGVVLDFISNSDKQKSRLEYLDFANTVDAGVSLRSCCSCIACSLACLLAVVRPAHVTCVCSSRRIVIIVCAAAAVDAFCCRQGVDRKRLKDHFRHIVLQFKAVSTKYRNLIAHLRTHNMSSVSVEVGVPLKAALQYATAR